MKEGTVFQLVCPGTKCNTSIPPYLLKDLLRKEEFERWDRLLLDKALGSMSDVVYCPRCSISCLADEDKNAQCQRCFFTFCSACKDPRHLGRQCLTPEQKLKVEMQLISLLVFALVTSRKTHCGFVSKSLSFGRAYIYTELHIVCC